jgi:hypothetical protein
VLGIHDGFTKVLTTYQIYHTWIHPLHHSPLSSHIPGIVSTFVPLTYMCTQYLDHIHPPSSSGHTHTIGPTGTNPRQDLFYPLVFQFCKRKKTWHFCLLKIAIQGVSLWHFHVYMYYNLNGSFPLFSSFYISPLSGEFNRFKNSIFILV